MNFLNIYIFSIENVVNYIKLDIFYWTLFIFGENDKVYFFVGAAYEWLNDGINLRKLVYI